MEAQTELMTKIQEDIEKNLPEIDIALSELSDDQRIYMELGAGYTEKRYLNGPGIFTHPVLFIIKRPGDDEPDCIERLAQICNHYKRKRKPPKGTTYQALGLRVAAEPNKIGRQEDGQVLYSCIINFKISY